MIITVSQLLKEREEMNNEINKLKEDLTLIKSEIAKESIRELIDVSLEKINEFDNKKIILNDTNKQSLTDKISATRSGVNDVKSFRIDTGIYKSIKEMSAKNNINIAEIINRSLEYYLDNNNIVK